MDNKEKSGTSSENRANDRHLPDDRRVLIDILKKNHASISSELFRRFPVEYPESKANQVDDRYRARWSSEELDNLIHALKTDDLSTLSYKKMVGDIFYESHHPVLSQLSTALAEIMFESDVIASFLIGHEMPSDVDTGQLLVCFEGFIQKVVTYNCSLYLQHAQEPGCLVSAWQANYFRRIGMEHISGQTNRNEWLSQQDSQRADEIRWQRRLASLTKRERQVLSLVLQGKTNGEIAAQLHVSQNTVKNHVTHLFDKMGVRSRTELVVALLHK